MGNEERKIIQAAKGQDHSSCIRLRQNTLPLASRESLRADATGGRNRRGGKIVYILLVVVLPIAAAILKLWLAAHITAH
jgi:hypothetical protein